MKRLHRLLLGMFLILFIGSFPVLAGTEEVVTGGGVDNLVTTEEPNQQGASGDTIIPLISSESEITSSKEAFITDVEGSLETDQTEQSLATENSQVVPEVGFWEAPNVQAETYGSPKISITAEGKLCQTEARKMLDIINQERQKAGVSPLRWDAQLEEIAFNRVIEISASFSHTRPNGEPWHTMNAKLNGENLAWGTASSLETMRIFMESNGHKNNILQSNFKSVGVSCLEVMGRKYWVQLFSVSESAGGMEALAAQDRNHEYSFYMQSDLIIDPAYGNISNRSIQVGESLAYKMILANTKIDFQGYKPAVYQLSSQIVTWKSSNTTQAIINSQGVVLGMRAGSVNVTGSWRDKVIHLSLQVVGGTSNQQQITNFVTGFYTNILKRSPDPEGLANWIFQLQSRNNTGAQVANGFLDSDELKNKNLSNESYVEILYKTILSRTPDPQGKANWLYYLGNGMTRQYVANQFYKSPEFMGLCKAYGIEPGQLVLTGSLDQNEGATMFVHRIYNKALVRLPDPYGHSNWVTAILNRSQTPEQVAEGFFNSLEFMGKNHSNKNYAIILYATFLDRQPDSEGLMNWIKELEKGVSRQQVLQGFSQSIEFKKIMAKYGL